MRPTIQFMRIRTVVALLVALMCGRSGEAETKAASRQAVQGLSLQMAVEIALVSNPLVRATDAGRTVAEAGVKEAEAGRMPLLSFNETFTNSNNPVYVFGTLLEQGEFSPHHFDVRFLNSPGSVSNFRSSVDLAVPLFNRFRVSAGIEKAKIGSESAEADMQWTQQQIRYWVVEAYYGVLVAEARKKVSEEAVKTAESDLESMKTRSEQGMIVQSDLLAMQVQLAEFQQQLVQATADANISRAGLNTVLSQPIELYQSIEGDLTERKFDIASLDELISRALKDRPDYQKMGMQVRMSEQSIREAKGQYWPDLNLFAQVGHSGQDWAGGSGDFAVGAKLSFNIVDFGRSAKIQKAVAASQGVKAQEEHLQDSLRLEVVQAYQQLKSSEERLRVVTAAVDQATEALRIVQDRHSVGLTTTTEVLRAQTAVLRAKMLRLGARYDYYLGFARTLLVTGSLTDVSPFSS